MTYHQQKLREKIARCKRLIKEHPSIRSILVDEILEAYRELHGIKHWSYGLSGTFNYELFIAIPYCGYKVAGETIMSEHIGKRRITI